MTAVAKAFRQARIQAVRHMAACERARLRWNETTITEIVTAHTSPAVDVVPFTQRAEALSGADWVWWWVDSASAYGMLVQAKRVTVTSSAWNFDFGYTTKGAARSQREVLRSAAERLGLLPVYALYLGTGDYRRWEHCADTHRRRRCIDCIKRTVSLMPALLADERLVCDAASTYRSSVALEDLWTGYPASAPLTPVLKNQLPAELSDFLRYQQDGTRAVSRSMIDTVLKARVGEFAAVSTSVASEHDGDHDRLGSVFGDLPDDTGHWGVRYFEHTLNPLQQTPPPYVLDIMAGDTDEDRLASDMPENVAGIVVVRVPQVG
ncbi:DUF6615 family protein [Nocardia sp. NPDC004340]